MSTPNLAWHVAYTFPNAEKRVERLIREMGYETFLPFQTIISQWSDRKRKLVQPLLPNYVFVKVEPTKRFKMLVIKELVRFVSFGGIPATISNKDIDMIRTIIAANVQVEVSENQRFSEGNKVRVVAGPFKDAQGVLVTSCGKQRLMVQIEALQRAICVEVLPEDLEAV